MLFKAIQIKHYGGLLANHWGSSIIFEKDEKVIASWRGDREVREKVVINGGLTETTKNMTRPPKILKSL
ncbi:MAG: hypothetical protein QXR89_07485 [Candidatus Bathyarchaeia archaeon]